MGSGEMMEELREGVKEKQMALNSKNHLFGVKGLMWFLFYMNYTCT